MTVTISAYLRESSDFFTEHDPDATYILATTYESDRATPLDAANEAFQRLNIGTDEIANEYRAAGHRSLSVGDVVVVDADGPVALLCARFGWDLLPNFAPLTQGTRP
jgi:hypothetical protein